MARPKARTGAGAAPWSTIVGPEATENFIREVRKIVGPPTTNAFLKRVADAIAECQAGHQRDTAAPTKGESTAALLAIFQHSEDLLKLLGRLADELVEPLRSLSAAIGRDQLEQLRQSLRVLSEESVVARRPYLSLPKGMQPGLANPHQVLLGLRCWEALETIGIKPSLTNAEGQPTSVYLSLFDWALKVAGLGGDARKIGSHVKKVQKRD